MVQPGPTPNPPQYTTSVIADANLDQDDGLAEFGYKQSLDRSIGKFASFAAGVSYISILTGTFQLFYFGFGSAGPAYLWSWPLVFVGQLCVGLCFMELAARYPVAGSVYNWAKILGSKLIGWFSGWMMLMASVVSIAAVVLALQSNLPLLWSGFNFVDGNPGLNAIILGAIAITFTTVVNAISVKLMALINSVGVFIELIAAVLIAFILMFSIKRSPSVLLDTFDTGSGHSTGYLGAFLVGSIASGYVMYGFDTASSLGEETVEPRRTAPKAIMRALLASFVIGGAILVFAVLAAPDLRDPKITEVGGLQTIVTEVMAGWMGKIFLVCILVAVLVCSLAVHTAAIRIAFAMGRDNALPLGETLATVHPRTKTPVVPAIVIGVIALLILVLNYGNPKIFTIVTSMAIIMVYISYLLVTGPMLMRRVRGTYDSSNPGYFTMGRWGMAVNVLAVLWGLAMAINIAWPRAAVYGEGWYNTYAAFLYIGGIAAIGLAWYLSYGRKHIGTLAAHSSA